MQAGVQLEVEERRGEGNAPEATFKLKLGVSITDGAMLFTVTPDDPNSNAIQRWL